MTRLALLSAFLACGPVAAQEEYGAKGLFPVYETSGQWVVFDKRPNKQHPTPLGQGERFLVVGDEGAQVFEVRRTSGTYGAMCRAGKPLKLRAGLLVGPRRVVGRPIFGIHVPARFTLKGSRAEYHSLANTVSDDTYATLGEALRASTIEDVKNGSFRFRLDDPTGDAFAQNPKPEKIQLKIDFAAALAVQGLKKPLLLIEETGIGASSRRCLRLADAGVLVGKCAEMPRALMAETGLLQFVSYDPSGKGSPFVLGYTKTPPLWGDERWGFIVRETGPRLFLLDAVDPRCRQTF